MQIDGGIISCMRHKKVEQEKLQIMGDMYQIVSSRVRYLVGNKLHQE